jgi:hypothetical protein
MWGNPISAWWSYIRSMCRREKCNLFAEDDDKTRVAIATLSSPAQNVEMGNRTTVAGPVQTSVSSGILVVLGQNDLYPDSSV